MTQTTQFQLSGLTCGACEKIISKRLKTIEGVVDVQVSSLNGVTSVIASRTIDQQEIKSALQGTHYKVISNL